MQNRYVGDVGDFAKYGLLRALGRGEGGWRPRLAVVWYLVPDEEHNSDGRHTGYLDGEPPSREAWRACDPDLLDGLRRLVERHARSVQHVKDASLLPAATFVDSPLEFGAHERRLQREQRRAEWLRTAVEKCAGSEVVFLDPDNGLEVKAGRFTKRGPKYAYFDDLDAFAGESRSLIVYQHATRQGSVEEQIRRRLQELKRRFPDREPFALHFLRVSPRAFLFVPTRQHARGLRRRCRDHLEGPWGRHFHWVEREGGA